MNKKLILEQKIESLGQLKDFWKSLILNHFEERTLCLLVGPVGAGKTESLKQICQIYGLTESIASPSFAIHHQYANSQGIHLDHVDLYRLESEEDLESTGFWDLFQQHKSWIFVEWANLVALSSWPLDWKILLIEIDRFDKDTNKEQRWIKVYQI